MKKGDGSAFLCTLGGLLLAAAIIMMLASCATVPNIQHGWVDLDQVNSRCVWQLRGDKTRLVCSL